MVADDDAFESEVLSESDDKGEKAEKKVDESSMTKIDESSITLQRQVTATSNTLSGLYALRKQETTMTDASFVRRAKSVGSKNFQSMRAKQYSKPREASPSAQSKLLIQSQNIFCSLSICF